MKDEIVSCLRTLKNAAQSFKTQNCSVSKEKKTRLSNNLFLVFCVLYIWLGTKQVYAYLKLHENNCKTTKLFLIQKVPVLTVEKINLTHQNWSRKPIQIIIINYPKKNPVCSKCKNVLIKRFQIWRCFITIPRTLNQGHTLYMFPYDYITN